MSELVTCLLCDLQFKKITNSHLKIHSLTVAEYRDKFPNAVITCDSLREVSRNVGLANKGRSPWSKGRTFSSEYRKRISESHWSKKPIIETAELRAKLSENGKRVMSQLNIDGRAFRMPKGFHSQEFKDKMRLIMTNRSITWNDKISANHWTRKDPVTVSLIMEKLNSSGFRSSKRGRYFSAKMNQEFFFMSSYEERRMKFLDECSEIVKFTNKHNIWIDYEWNGSSHRYNPDLLVTMQNGSMRLEEIKGYIADDGRVSAKELACKAFATSQGLDYKLIFEDDLERL